jgi:hypothetical protein
MIPSFSWKDYSENKSSPFRDLESKNCALGEDYFGFYFVYDLDDDKFHENIPKIKCACIQIVFDHSFSYSGRAIKSIEFIIREASRTNPFSSRPTCGIKWQEVEVL